MNINKNIDKNRQQIPVLVAYFIMVLTVVLVVVIFGTKLNSNETVAQALKTQKQADSSWKSTDKQEFNYLGIKTEIPETNKEQTEYKWAAYPVTVAGNIDAYVILHTDIESYSNLIESSILDLIYDTNTEINTDISIVSIKTSETSEREQTDISKLQNNQIIDRISSLDWKNDNETNSNYEISRKVIDNTGAYIEINNENKESTRIIYLIDNLKNIETAIEYNQDIWSIEDIHEILNHIETDKESDRTDIDKIDNDFKAYFKTYTDNTMHWQQVIDSINNKINLRYEDEEQLRNFDRNSILNSTKSSNYTEYKQTLTANNQEPQSIQGYKYMKSLGVYRIISTDLGKQYELVGTALPFRYYTDGGVVREVENNVTSIETRTWTQSPDINNNVIGTDFQYRIECIDTSEYTDSLQNDTIQKLIDKQKSIFDNGSETNQVYYEIQTDIESDNQAQMIVYHLTKPRTSEDFNELTDIDIIQAYKYIIETQNTSEISKNKYNLTVTIATSYKSWFSNYTTETLDAFNEWADMYKVNTFDMQDLMQTILIKEDAIREEARQQAIIEAAKKAAQKNRKTTSKKG